MDATAVIAIIALPVTVFAGDIRNFFLWVLRRIKGMPSGASDANKTRQFSASRLWPKVVITLIWFTITAVLFCRAAQRAKLAESNSTQLSNTIAELTNKPHNFTNPCVQYYLKINSWRVIPTTTTVAYKVPFRLLATVNNQRYSFPNAAPYWSGDGQTVKDMIPLPLEQDRYDINFRTFAADLQVTNFYFEGNNIVITPLTTNSIYSYDLSDNMTFKVTDLPATNTTKISLPVSLKPPISITAVCFVSSDSPNPPSVNKLKGRGDAGAASSSRATPALRAPAPFTTSLERYPAMQSRRTSSAATKSSFRFTSSKTESESETGSAGFFQRSAQTRRISPHCHSMKAPSTLRGSGDEFSLKSFTRPQLKTNLEKSAASMRHFPSFTRYNHPSSASRVSRHIQCKLPVLEYIANQQGETLYSSGA